MSESADLPVESRQIASASLMRNRYQQMQAGYANQGMNGGGGYNARGGYNNYDYDYDDYNGGSQGNRGFGSYGAGMMNNLRTRQQNMLASNPNTYSTGSGSGYGGASDQGPISRGGYGSFSSGYSECDSGISIALLLISLAGIAVMWYILYTKLVAAQRRKKRSLDNTDIWWFVENIEGIVLTGLEEFEEKIDKIAEGENAGEDSWITKIYNKFSGYNDVDNELTDEDMDGIEPPMLDETWGLGQRIINKNVTGNFDELPFAVHNRTERAADVEDEMNNTVEAEGEEKCRVQMWRCLSGVIEGGLHYVDSPDGLMGLAKKTMFKMAFHGGFSNIWNSVMTIPEARKTKKCMNVHSDCISYEILRREAQATMDPNDPSYSMYDKKVEEVNKEAMEDAKKPVKEEKKEKKKRLIINPEFVQSMDQGDGSTQYDEDYQNDAE